LLGSSVRVNADFLSVIPSAVEAVTQPKARPAFNLSLFLWIFLLGATFSLGAEKRQAAEPNRERSPLGTYLIKDTRLLDPPEIKHSLSLAHRDRPKQFYNLLKYDWFADLFFSHDEKVSRDPKQRRKRLNASALV
jgi:hypothetical protein